MAVWISSICRALRVSSGSSSGGGGNTGGGSVTVTAIPGGEVKKVDELKRSHKKMTASTSLEAAHGNFLRAKQAPQYIASKNRRQDAKQLR